MKRGQRITAAIAAVALIFAGAAGALLLAGGYIGSSPQSVSAQEQFDNRGISVQGEGQISVTPDVARIVLGVEVEGSNLDDLREDADSRMNEVIEALMQMGFKEANIRTLTYDIRVKERPVEPVRPIEEPEVEDDPATDDAVTEEDDVPDVDTLVYILVQLVQVRISDIDAAGEVIDTALDAGANRVSSISFEVEDRGAAVEQARELAVDEARHKAEHLAELTGVSVGPPLKIEESSPPGPPMRMEEYAMDDEMAADGAMARIEPGEQTISVSVYITYRIE